MKFVFRLAVPLALVCGLGFELSAQDTESSDVGHLDALTQRLVSHLASLPGYTVEVTQQWQLDGAHAAAGQNRFRLAARHGGQCRLELDSAGKSGASLICCSDGQQITRLMQFENQFIHSVEEGGLVDLLHDAMTEVSLRHSGLDLLCRENADEHVMVMASDIEYVGQQELPDGPAHHFRMKWGGDADNRQEIWISAGHDPLLLKVVTTLRVLPGDETDHQLKITSDLGWQRVDRHPAGHFSPAIPEGSVKVTDLHCYLVEGGTLNLVGKPAPVVPLQDLDGMAWNLPRDKRAVVLYFFATWALPSHHEKDELLEMMNDMKQHDVSFFAVNVGEDAAAVRAFVESRKYDHTIVLDPQKQLTSACQVTALPAVVVIGEDGTVVTSHVGNTARVRAELQADLHRMLGLQDSEPVPADGNR
jgi:peroxiredoxin